MRSPIAGIVAAAFLCFAGTPASQAAVDKGPAGLAFYTPPETLPKGTHGTPIWVRGLTGKAKLTSAKSNRLLLYLGQQTSGHDTAISGTVHVPKGKAPRGGWPIVTWAHGTIGIADACAPSRVGMPAQYDHKLLNTWLKAGYAVVRTDYEGLGTPTTHPYLIGVSEGRAVLDMVRGARKLDRSLGKRVVIAGHSQGGHAALWAGALAGRWTPELDVRGTLALAPASHLGEQAALLGALTAPGPLTGLAAMIVRGVDVDRPALNAASLLSDRARVLFPQVDEVCLSDLTEGDSFGGLAPSELLRPDGNLAPVIGALNENDPETLKIRSGPVQIEQGTTDTTVLPLFTNQLVPKLKAGGANVTYKTYTGVDHAGAVLNSRAAADATKFVRSRLSR
ncbi:alpha/beta fold hydrolase [Solirubrobacter sp. CPCC 204708]|uniref:Alpha/beta fold hydrolase n=1 Tax=Solirubrobacter deserti TaxID=2282478 RepID=A0ABT4RL97_9ACTN|nr:alpha/beta fold hydrolase [Solirubrobacter deserti]MBE2318995.1 alpha/beta fold hydrolase [Solirubrobacter deserti]MDA0139280.1 alpha/beta fold hydrolase [Solirubrobacter deserti]